jgi:hypothetical protein
VKLPVKSALSLEVVPESPEAWGILKVLERTTLWIDCRGFHQSLVLPLNDCGSHRQLAQGSVSGG